MKISIISKTMFVALMALSLSSFASDKKGSAKETSNGKTVSFDASIFQLNNSQKVKLAIDKGDDANLRVLLKDQNGATLYNELFSKGSEQYRRIFDLEGVTDGTYVFELQYKDQKLTKEVQILSTSERVISFE